MKVYSNLFNKIISPENLFAAWDEFRSDKWKKPGVMRFERHLEENIFALHRELKAKTYRHGSYRSFYIRDPKQRHIHKAIVRDRILHHAIFSIINPLFEPTFISRSFSCRVDYGTHRGVAALEGMARKMSRNGTHDCFILKCDVRKFFDSVDHAILLEIMEKRIKDEGVIWLLKEIIKSYPATPVRERERRPLQRKGIPIGNLTSQLFANVYMNEFDQFMKHTMKVKNYVRYTDDFAIVADDRTYLEDLLPHIRDFLARELTLELHPKKITIRPFPQGMDFLGHILFPKYRLIRTKTEHRMFRNLKRRFSAYEARQITKTTFEQSLQSYLGTLSHANTYDMREELLNRYWLPREG
jgi:retron-type reverse transcriptase